MLDLNKEEKVLFPLGDVHSGESKKKTLVWKKKEKGSSDKVDESMGGGVPLTPQELEIQKKMSRLNVRLARKRS